MYTLQPITRGYVTRLFKQQDINDTAVFKGLHTGCLSPRDLVKRTQKIIKVEHRQDYRLASARSYLHKNGLRTKRILLDYKDFKYSVDDITKLYQFQFIEKPWNAVFKNSIWARRPRLKAFRKLRTLKYTWNANGGYNPLLQRDTSMFTADTREYCVLISAFNNSPAIKAGHEKSVFRVNITSVFDIDRFYQTALESVVFNSIPGVVEFKAGYVSKTQQVLNRQRYLQKHIDLLLGNSLWISASIQEIVSRIANAEIKHDKFTLLEAALMNPTDHGYKLYYLDFDIDKFKQEFLVDLVPGTSVVYPTRNRKGNVVKVSVKDICELIGQSYSRATADTLVPILDSMFEVASTGTNARRYWIRRV